MKRVTVNQEVLENLFKVISNSRDNDGMICLGTPAKRFCKTWLAELDPKDLSDTHLKMPIAYKIKEVDLTNPAEVFDLEEEGHNGKWKF